jgi:hypothetical protein
MHIIATHISKDEPCHGLHQFMRGGRLIEQVFVVRGDAIAKFETDYGPASDFPDFTESIYPSFGENSVGQLQELAEMDRHSDKWAKRRREMQAESTLIQDILRQEEVLMEVRKNRSHFGPGTSVQRIDYPSKEVWRQFKEKRKNGKRNS